MKPLDLLDTAFLLTDSRGKKKPRQSDLKRALSSVYYAVFHALARSCADSFAGTTKKSRPDRAWSHVYRSLEHKDAKNACQQKDMNEFPEEIQDFANTFVTLQIKRHKADYDPFEKVYKSEVLVEIEKAKDAIRKFERCNQTDKKAFAVWVLLKKRS